jgi:hypothetical protein
VDPAVSYAAQYFCDQPKTGAYELTLYEAIEGDKARAVAV